MAEDSKDSHQPPKPPPLPPSLLALPSVSGKNDAEKRIVELEKRLAEEHEKLLLADLKSQQEAANAARVEMSIRELQEKLRREHREAEAEEARRVLVAKVQDLEARLVQERETWGAALKNQMQGGTQEHEAETHLAKRLEELEQHWLHEKAALAKDETAVHVQIAAQKEKEVVELKGELALARQQCAMLEARLEHELGELRIALREREERLSSLRERLAEEHEAELRRVKAEACAEVLKHKEAAQSVASERQRLKAVAGALERQLAAARTQVGELKRVAAQGELAQERAKAEFVVIQRRWMEREKEIRSEVVAQAQEKLQAQLSRLKLAAQEEINQRLARVAQEMHRHNDSELRQREVALCIEIEREKEELQRLSAAQAAQIKALEEALQRPRSS